MKSVVRFSVLLMTLAPLLAWRPVAVAETLPTLLPPGPFHTAGSQIMDREGRAIRLACVGLNQPNFIVPMQAQARNMVASGFNCIRMSWVNAKKTTDLAVIDRVLAAIEGTGLRLILDNHTNEAGTAADGYGAQQKNGLWYDKGGASDGTNGARVPGTVTDARFVADWVDVARHYAGNDTIIGYDLRNEPLHYRNQCTWGDGNINTDIRLMYQRVGNAIQAIDQDKLIIAEGPQNWDRSFDGSGPAPEGDLTMVKTKPVILTVPDKIVYSVHLYANYHPNSGGAAIARMNRVWGYLVTRNIAPVWIGETGASLDGSVDSGDDLASQRAFYATLVPYLNGQEGARGGPVFAAGQQAIGTTWWVWGHLQGQSPDGTLERDWVTPKPSQKAIYSRFQQTALPPGISDRALAREPGTDTE